MPLASFKVEASSDLGPLENGNIVDIKRQTISIVVDGLNDDIVVDRAFKQQVFQTVAGAIGYIRGRDSIQLSVAEFTLYTEEEKEVLRKKYAKKVIGIDINVDRILFAKERNLNVKICDYRTESIPQADIHYFWPSNSLRDTPYLVWRLVSKMDHNRVIIFGCDNAVKNDRLISYLYSIFSKRLTFRYNEGSGFRENGFFSINIVYTSDIFFFN